MLSIKEKGDRGHEFEREQGRSTWEGLEGGKEDICNYIIPSKY